LALEVKVTLREPRLMKIIKASVLEDFIETFPKGLIMVQVKSKVKICRDPKDDFLLALSKDAKADYLITGDNDLLEMNVFGKTKMLTMTAFLELLSS
jgi:uncharacterized protein